MSFYLQALFSINVILSELQKLKIQVLNHQGFLIFLNNMHPKFRELIYKKVQYCCRALRLTSKVRSILKSDRWQVAETNHIKPC